MKNLFFAQTLLIGLFAAPAPTALAADGYHNADVVAPARLACRIFPATGEKNTYTLTMVRPEAQPVEIRILARDGKVVNRTTVKENAEFARLDLRDLDAGQYMVQVRAGRQLSEQKVTVQ